MSFDDAERSEATQALELCEEDYKEEGLIPLRYVKFQNVQSVTVQTGGGGGVICFVLVPLLKPHRFTCFTVFTDTVCLLLSFLHQMFVKSNQGDEETTKINYLTFIGTPVQATNMNDFKRVRSRLCELVFSVCLFVCLFVCLCVGLMDVLFWAVVGRGEERRESLNRRMKKKRRGGGEEGYRYMTQELSLCQSHHTHTHTHTHTHSASSCPPHALNDFSVCGVYKPFVL